MKRSAKTLILLLVLIAFAGGYWLMNNTETATQVSEESGSFELTAKTIDDLTGLAWVKSDVSYHFTKADGAWANADNAAFPVNQEAVQALADDLLALTATRKLEAVTDLAAYGLAEPAFTVTAAWSDGTSTTYAMGDATPFADGYYLTLGQEGVAYTVGSSLSTLFSDTMTDLAQMETIPTTETVTRMTVGTALDVYYQETSSTINADQHWYDASGHALDGVDDLVADAQEIEWKELVAPVATDEELTAWQLDDAATAITLYNGETEAVKLLIGSTDESGNYYARLPESTMVYTVASSSLSTLLTAATENLLTTALVETDYASLQEATFATAEKTYVLTPAVQDEEIAEAEAEAADTADEANEELWSLLTAITATSHTEANDGEALLTVNITTTEGKTATVSFAAYDVNNYTATMDTRTLLVSADKVDKLIRAVKAAQ